MTPPLTPARPQAGLPSPTQTTGSAMTALPYDFHSIRSLMAHYEALVAPMSVRVEVLDKKWLLRPQSPAYGIIVPADKFETEAQARAAADQWESQFAIIRSAVDAWFEPRFRELVRKPQVDHG